MTTAWKRQFPKTAIRKALVKACYSCQVQYKGWPCRTCLPEWFDEQMWQAVLYFRGDYDDWAVVQDGVPGYKRVTGMRWDHEKNCGIHEYGFVSTDDVVKAISRLCAHLGVHTKAAH